MPVISIPSKIRCECPIIREKKSQKDQKTVVSVDICWLAAYFLLLLLLIEAPLKYNEDDKMKVRSSLKSAKARDKNCRVVKRRGRLYVINKQNPRFKARQG